MHNRLASLHFVLPNRQECFFHAWPEVWRLIIYSVAVPIIHGQAAMKLLGDFLRSCARENLIRPGAYNKDRAMNILQTGKDIEIQARLCQNTEAYSFFLGAVSFQ